MSTPSRIESCRRRQGTGNCPVQHGAVVSIPPPWSISDGCFLLSIVACEYRAKVRIINWSSAEFWLDVARMSRAHTSRVLDEYQAAVDEIVASCNGDLRGAVRALMLANE
jgi:hypothetical protein